MTVYSYHYDDISVYALARVCPTMSLLFSLEDKLKVAKFYSFVLLCILCF